MMKSSVHSALPFRSDACVHALAIMSNCQSLRRGVEKGSGVCFDPCHYVDPFVEVCRIRCNAVGDLTFPGFANGEP